MKVYLDFDGTVVEHKYPEIGDYNPGAFDVVKKLIEAGHDVILNTYRVELSRESLHDAMNYVLSGLGLENMKFTTAKKHPVEWDFNLFREIDEIYIDDCGKNHPLRRDVVAIDWNIVNLEFELNGMY